MGFVSFVKKLFGVKETTVEVKENTEEIQAVVINTTPELVKEELPSVTQENVLENSVVESQITDSVTSQHPTEDVVETVKSNKKVVIKKRNYKPKTEVTKKSIPSGRKRVGNHGKGK